MATAKEALIEGGQATFTKSVEKVTFELEPQTIGLTREQLESYRNDPLWKPIRTVLFVAFWLLWIAMFGVAVAIVVLSPKCAARSKPDWWQTKVSYQLLTPTFYDSDGDGVGDFLGISKKLDLLKKIGVTTVYPTPVIKTMKDDFFSPYEVLDHESLDGRFGADPEADFKALVEAVHDRNMYIVIDLPISSVSVNHTRFREGDLSFFVTRTAGQAGYSDAKFFDFPGMNDTKYLGWRNSKAAVLNWESEAVKEMVVQTADRFLRLGVDGFHLDHISLLAVDANGNSDQDVGVKRVRSLIDDIRMKIDAEESLKDKKIVIFSSDRDVDALHADVRSTGHLHYVIDNSFANLNASDSECADSVALCVYDTLDKAFDKHEGDGYIPHWQFSNSESSRLASRFDSETAHLLTFMQLSLPGALSVYYGQELNLMDVTKGTGQTGIMQWMGKEEKHHGFSTIDDIFFGETENDKDQDNFDYQWSVEQSELKTVARVAKLRQRDEALPVGKTLRAHSQGVVLISRFLEGVNGTATGHAYVAALNFNGEESELNLADSNLEILPSNKVEKISNAEVSAVTAGLTTLRARQKIDLTIPVTLPAKQGVLFKL